MAGSRLTQNCNTLAVMVKKNAVVFDAKGESPLNGHSRGLARNCELARGFIVHYSNKNLRRIPFKVRAILAKIIY